MNKILKDAFPNVKLTYVLPKILDVENNNPLGQNIWTELDKFILPKCVTQKELQAQIEKLTDAEKYIDNLSRLACYTRTRYDYEQTLVHLTHQQQSIVNQVKFNRDFLVKGSAGTGKSLVLLKTL